MKKQKVSLEQFKEKLLKERREAKNNALEQTLTILPAILECKQILKELTTRIEIDSPPNCKRAKLMNNNADMAGAKTETTSVDLIKQYNNTISKLATAMSNWKKIITSYNKGIEDMQISIGTKFVDVNLGMWTIYSLSFHLPTMEHIDVIVTSLNDIEQDFLNFQSEANKSEEETDVSTDSSDVDFGDNLRIYDKTTSMLRQIPPSNNGIVSHNYRGKPISELVNQIRQTISTEHSIDLSSYILLNDCIQELVAFHGTQFQRVANQPSSITLVIPSINESISFDANLREQFRQMLKSSEENNPSMKNTLLIKENLSCCSIYRFRCIVCQQRPGKQFNYVGQARHFYKRYKSHLRKMWDSYMEHEDRMAAYNQNKPVPKEANKIAKSVLYEHVIHEHGDVVKFSDVLEVDIVHDMPGYAKSHPRDTRVRRSWELFNQWLFKAMAEEGGGSRR